MQAIEKPLEGTRILKLTKAEVKKIEDAKKLIKVIAFYTADDWKTAHEALENCTPAQEISL